MPHSSIIADFNNDCVGDLFLNLDKASPAMLFALLSSDKKVTYCLTDVSSTSRDDETVIASFPNNVQNYAFPLFN